MVRRQRGMLFTFIFYILFTFYTIACDSRALRPEPQKQSLSIECIVVVEEKCMSGLNILFWLWIVVRWLGCNRSCVLSTLVVVTQFSDSSDFLCWIFFLFRCFNLIHTSKILCKNCHYRPVSNVTVMQLEQLLILLVCKMRPDLSHYFMLFFNMVFHFRKYKSAGSPRAPIWREVNLFTLSLWEFFYYITFLVEIISSKLFFVENT